MRRADRAWWHVAGWALRRPHVREGRRQSGERPPGGALGGRAVAAAQASGRGTKAEGDRDQPVDGLCLQRWVVERRATGHERGARPLVDVALPERRTPSTRAHRVAAA